MIVNLEEVKQHLRVDTNEDDTYIQGLIQASEQFVKNATGKTFNDTNHLAKTVCLLLIGDMYENRIATTEKVGTKMRELVVMMLTQLAYDDRNENQM